jgi:hypothetical protein
MEIKEAVKERRLVRDRMPRGGLEEEQVLGERWANWEGRVGMN